ncbi:MAG: pimeloyl-ACP methyl ester esterase BioH [Gallionella sp.]|nr:pimeloyl-ACP methyl ester esterase BioH [Gallionella sp.]
MTLHVETRGHGAPLVLLHGWGMHGGMWGRAADLLAAHFQVHLVDLPGHGASAEHLPFIPGELVDLLARRFHEPVNVCGWSLGGMLAQHWAARKAGHVRRVILVASTPCFAVRHDWACGMPRETLAQFADELENNHAATLRRFLALQLRGSDNEKLLLTGLRAQIFARGEPVLSALRGGLDILRDADLRPALPEIPQPALLIAGERDKLTPPAASRYMADILPDAKYVEIEGAAHAPFLSHPEVFIEHVKRFLHE